MFVLQPLRLMYLLNDCLFQAAAESQLRAHAYEQLPALVYACCKTAPVSSAISSVNLVCVRSSKCTVRLSKYTVWLSKQADCESVRELAPCELKL